MKKIYTKSVFEFNKKTGKYQVNESESRFHYINDHAPLSQMKGGGGGGSSRTVQTTNTAPWSSQQPYLAQGFATAKGLYFDEPNPTYYPGSTVVPFSGETEESLQGIAARARAGSPLVKDAQGLLSKTIAGDYLYGGQGFDAALNAARNKIIPDVESQFARQGRSGSGLARAAEAGQIGDSFAGLYNDERTRQQAAAGMAPSMAESDYRDFDRLGNVGMRREELSNEQLQDNMSRYDYSQNIRRRMLEEYMGLIQGNYGGSTTSSVPNQGGGMQGWQRYLLNAGQGAAGGALYGGAAGGIGALPGAAIGGGVGLLSSFFQ